MSSHQGPKVHKSTAHSNGGGPPMPKVVGPNVQGNREEYQLVRRLQSALFGGVYEAKGLSSNRDFAIKVLHKSELTKAQESSSIEFCEVPLSEIRFAELMRGHPHVMEPEEHFEDAYCFYVVFELCRGGDLLEALKQKPHGFDESHAQFLIKQAAKGLAFLHERKVAMQDVSLENMLLHVQESTGHYQVKICDPGQAVIFETDQDGEEIPVGFRGLVGKSFRPPELHDQQPYCATKVDSWCLGWSTFYLLTAQPLFMSADPAQQDADWLLFQTGDFASLFQQKCNLCSPTALDFIFRLLQIKPRNRMSIAEALNHSWLADPSVEPVRAPKEILAEMMGMGVDSRPLEVIDNYDGNQQNQQVYDYYDNNQLAGSAQLSQGGGYNTRNELPTWSSANANAGLYSSGGPIFGGVPYSGSNAVPFGSRPDLRMPVTQRARDAVRSPPRSPRSPRTSGGPPRLAFDPPRSAFDPRFNGADRAHYQNPARMAHVISTAHSPVPQGLNRGSPPPRAGSPLQRELSPGNQNGTLSSSYSANTLNVNQQGQPYSNTAMTPRSGSGRHSPGQSPLNSAVPPPNNQEEGGERSRGRAWAFRSESPGRVDGTTSDYGNAIRRAPSPLGNAFGNAGNVLRPGSSSWQVPGAQYQGGTSRVPGPHARLTQSPGRSGSGITFGRGLSPGLLEATGSVSGHSAAVRAHSPGANARALSPNGSLAGSSRLEPQGSGGFNWSTAPPISPRMGSGSGAPVSRIASPGGVSRIASPGGAMKPAQAPLQLGQGFAWSPEPPSPRTSPRSYSPGPALGGSNLPRWPAM